jgi:hypothetical protein
MTRRPAATGLTPATPVGWLMIAYLTFGIGSGLVNPPITNTAVSGMPRAQAGVAAGVASTSRQVGQSLGVAVVGAAVTSALHGPLRAGFTEASHVGWWIIAGFWRRRTGRRRDRAGAGTGHRGADRRGSGGGGQDPGGR